MIRSIVFLLALISINCSLVAQQTNVELKAAPDAAGSNPGFKKQTSSASEKRLPPNTSSPAPTEKQKTIATSNKAPQVTAADAAKASEIMRIDYNNMPADVQASINNNKAQGKYLLEGIAKAFLVEIKTCLTDADQKKTLSFLKTNKGFIKSQFIVAGQVKIIVEPTFDSAELKDAMAAKGIQFNFLNRSYLLKN